ncbi:MAG: DUF2891 domain-containing protein [Burkholderiales bacterium]|nr:DUF2891 domain-containing protein [Burkholderiales bacterium]
MMAGRLTPDLARQYAGIALANVVREYPGKPDHVLASDADLRPPRVLHPAFHGSFDWHSCVHMHWLLARVRRLHPQIATAEIEATFDRHLTSANIAQECAYLARPEARAFERTYGWAWLLELARELRGTRWESAIAPLADAFVTRYLDYLPRQRHPLRHGLHANSAFGLAFALDYARAAGRGDLARACVDAASRWFAHDRAAPAAWEPSGADFLSPVLMEAALMQRVMTAGDFSAWLDGFLPGIEARSPAALFAPVAVDDRTDGFIVHLDGLNLSRAWCMRAIAAALPENDVRGAALRSAAQDHLDAGLAGLASADYAGEHWLATFATLALTS